MNRKTAENQCDMATAYIEGRLLEHDTTMCGASKAWFPMEVTYSHELHELKVKAEICRMDIEKFVPIIYQVMDVSSLFLVRPNFICICVNTNKG